MGRFGSWLRSGPQESAEFAEGSHTMKKLHTWPMTCLRLLMVLASLLLTSIGANLQKKPIEAVSLLGLFVVCGGLVVGLPCTRRLERRFCEKHGWDFLRWLKYGWLGVFHGTSRWLLVAIFLGKLLDVSHRGWGVLLQFPALLLFGFALYCGYPGLESYALAASQRCAERAWWRGRVRSRTASESD